MVSKILGHAKVFVTLDIYADAMPDARTRGMEAMNGVMRKLRASEGKTWHRLRAYASDGITIRQCALDCQAWSL